MKDLTITITDDLQSYLEGRVAQGPYIDPGDYIRDLIWHDQIRMARERVEELILQGINSGPAIPWTDDFRTEMRAEIKGHAAKLKASAP